METIYACSILSAPPLSKASALHNSRHGVRFFFTKPHSSPSRSYLLAGLKTLCETYPGKVLSRELFLPPGDFMEVDTQELFLPPGDFMEVDTHM